MVLHQQPRTSGLTFRPKPNEDDELREEYDLSQLPIMPRGRYAPERRVGSNLVVLDPDLARAFPSDEAVNKALRLILQAAEIPEKAGISYWTLAKNRLPKRQFGRLGSDGRQGTITRLENVFRPGQLTMHRRIATIRL